MTERVIEHEPRTRHRIAFEDPGAEGELLTEMTIEGEGTRVTLTLDYRLRRRGPIAWLAGLFARSQVQRSLERTLLQFRGDAEERARAASR